MSIQPIIAFKAGKCEGEFSTNPAKIKPLPEPGWLYLYNEDDLIHICWRGRAASLQNPDLDLVIVPADATFTPYTSSSTPGDTVVSSDKAIKGRIFKLAFLSSSARHFFWLQSSPQFKDTPSRFSERDLRIGRIVDELLQGGEVDTEAEITELRQTRGDEGDDGDTAMDDALVEDNAPTGGAGAGATGGDVRDEGEESREGGADGGRANQSSLHSQTQTAVQNFLKSLQSGTGNTNTTSAYQDPYTTLPDLLPADITTPALLSLPEPALDALLTKHLPHSLIYLALDTDPSDIPEASASQTDDEETATVLLEGLSLDQKKSIIERVARSPQFYQALASLTAAIRDGGLPGIADALGIDVENNGYINRAGGVALNGGKAVEAFVRGIEKTVKKDG